MTESGQKANKTVNYGLLDFCDTRGDTCEVWVPFVPTQNATNDNEGSPGVSRPAAYVANFWVLTGGKD